MPRIICQRAADGHWSAWFADRLETAFGGEWPADATERLVSTVQGLDVQRITADDKHSSDDRLVFVIEESQPCPECGGTGEYVGLSEKETCWVCRGVGRVT